MEGNVNGQSAGGICGNFAGSNGNCVVTNCIMKGDVVGIDSGGICGNLAGRDKGKCVVTGCIMEGDVVGKDSGGICGSNAGYNGNCVVKGCYSKKACTDTTKGNGIYTNKTITSPTTNPTTN